MQYKIEWMEKKQISGKDIIEASLSGEGVTPAEKVTIWKTDTKGEEFPGFDDLSPGHTVEGNLWSKPGSNFKTLYPAKEKRAKGNSNFRTEQIEKAQGRKAEFIEKAQDNKDWSIMVSSTMRDAVLLTIAEVGSNASTSLYENKVRQWRTFLVDNWDLNPTDKPPF